MSHLLWGSVLAVGALVVYDHLSGARSARHWAAECNGLRLTAARCTWLGDGPNRVGWVEDSVRREMR